MESWCSHIHWTEETHKDFYANFKTANAEEKSKALLHQAHLLSLSEEDSDLKYGESLLIQWMTIFRESRDRKKAYETLATIYKELNQREKAAKFKSLSAAL